jgi:hypothetical protein
VNAVVGAVACVWLGMVLAISFLEAPLKFRAPGVTLALGLGIGRLVFAALNRAEVVLALVVLFAAVIGPHPFRLVAAGAVAGTALVAQLVLVRPFLVRRSNRVLQGEQAPRARAHHAYIGLEVAKIAALVVLAWSALQQTT